MNKHVRIAVIHALLVKDTQPPTVLHAYLGIHCSQQLKVVQYVWTRVVHKGSTLMSGRLYSAKNVVRNARNARVMDRKTVLPVHLNTFGGLLIRIILSYAIRVMISLAWIANISQPTFLQLVHVMILVVMVSMSKRLVVSSRLIVMMAI